MFISETYNTLFMAKKGVLTHVLNFTPNKFSYYNYANRTLYVILVIFACFYGEHF